MGQRTFLRNYSVTIIILLSIQAWGRRTLLTDPMPDIAPPPTHNTLQKLEVKRAIVRNEGEIWGDGVQKKCQYPLAGASLETKRAIRAFSLKHAELRNFIHKPFPRQSSDEAYYAFQMYEALAKKYFETHDIRTCLGDSIDRVDDFCTTFSNWREMYKDERDKLIIPLSGKNESIYLTRLMNPNQELSRSGWSVYQKPSLLGHVSGFLSTGYKSSDTPRGTIQSTARELLTSHKNAFINLEFFNINYHKEDYRGMSADTHTHYQQEVKVPMSAIGLNSSGTCFGELSKPNVILEKSLATTFSHLDIHTRPGSNADVALSSGEGLNRGTLNLGAALEEIPQNLIALKQLLSNEEIPFCSGLEESAEYADLCEASVPCADANKGDRCIGSFTLAKLSLGKEAAKIEKKCMQDTCTGLNSAQCLESYVNIGKFQTCFQYEIAQNIGNVIKDKFETCLKDGDEMSACFAQLAVASAGAAATGGLESVTSASLASAGVFIRGAVLTGKLSQRSAKYLELTLKVGAKAANTTMDIAANPLPTNPKELKELIEFISMKKVAKETPSAQKRILAFVEDQAKKKLETHTRALASIQAEKSSQKQKPQTQPQVRAWDQMATMDARQMDPFSRYEK